MKKFFALIVAIVITLTLVACGPKYEELASDTTGDISIMLWSGDGSYTEDIGHKDLAPEDLSGQNVAAIYAVAKAFNEEYPNIKINVYAKSGGPDDGGVSWDQEFENFKEAHGKYPDIWASTDLPNDTIAGKVADLSVFADDPVYQSFNEGVMSTMNYYGVQAGLPQFLQPWGVFVNTGLAEDHNLDVPEPDWTIEEYTDFVAHSEQNVYYGSMDTPKSFIFTGTNTMAKQMLSQSGDEPFIDMNSSEVRALIPYIAEWSEDSVWPQWDAGNIDQATFMEPNGWWSYNFFKNGKLLTLDGDPWMMGDAAHPDEAHWGRVQSTGWDIYPRPSTDYVGNTVGLVLDPLALYNYGMLDENPEYTEEESAKLKVAYTFAKFWIGDDAAWQARADQEWNDQGTLKTAMNDSFPLVTGEGFDRQMDIWYGAPTHARFEDETLMPGFHYILELWNEGNVWDVSDKAFPWFYDNDGTKTQILNEWNNFNLPTVLTGDPEATSPTRTDAGFTDAVLTKLPTWNTEANQRFATVVANLQDALMEFYGKTEEDF